MSSVAVPLTRPGSTFASGPRPRILCVDDEPYVLEALGRQLRRSFDVSLAESGPTAIELLQQDGGFAVIVSDLQMPGMNGVALLERARELAPDTVRVLLTGQADLDTAVEAVNDGQVFRFLCKPCPAPRLQGALMAAVEQNRLITAERVLLQETLRGSIRALSDALALANPVAFGRATRAKNHAARVAQRLGLADRWEVEVAAMLSQIGVVGLPLSTAEKLYAGAALDPAEQEMADRLPQVADELLSAVPRLDGVREIIRLHDRPFCEAGAGGRWAETVPIGARILKAVLDFDALESQGRCAADAIRELQTRPGQYDPAVLEAIAALSGTAATRIELREVPLHAVRPGMRFAQDVRTRTGLLLIPKGFEANAALMERLRSLPREVVAELVWMSLS